MRVVRAWSFEDKAILHDLYPGHRTDEVAKTLQRSVSSVQRMAQMLGIKKSASTLSAIRRDGAKKSVGSAATRFQRKHGRAESKRGAYGVWLCMKQRCEYTGHKSFHHYGGRGILICEKWKSYEGFFEDMGDPPFDGATLGRIDNDGDYEPGNCRWESHKQQARNRSTTRYVVAWGEKRCLSDWSDRFGIRPDTLSYRLSRGMAPEEAMTRPVAGVRQ